MKTNIIHLAHLRVQIHNLQRETDDILRTVDRTGITSALLDGYERLDTRILTARMELVDGLRKALAAAQETP